MEVRIIQIRDGLNNAVVLKIHHYTLVHRSMKFMGVDTFTFQVIHEVKYIDVETLYIKESVLMNEYSSIESGYNVKHSADLHNLF